MASRYLRILNDKNSQISHPCKRSKMDSNGSNYREKKVYRNLSPSKFTSHGKKFLMALDRKLHFEDAFCELLARLSSTNNFHYAIVEVEIVR